MGIVMSINYKEHFYYAYATSEADFKVKTTKTEADMNSLNLKSASMIVDSWQGLPDVVENKEKELDPNAAWRLQRKMLSLAVSIQEDDRECDVCGSRCGKHDTIDLDSGTYYVCCDECADEALEF